MKAQQEQRQSPVFQAGSIGSLRLRNRLIRSSCFEGMTRDGQVTEELIEHHRRVAAGGIAMTTVAYAAVDPDGRSFGQELWLREELLPGLRRLTDAVHREGAAASIQLVHCGFFASPAVIGRKPLGASRKLCLYRMAICDSMSREDIEAKTAAYARTARLAREGGFDAVEVHAGHGYLLSQFLSPWTNRRRDEYGGSPEKRLRFPVEVVRSVREVLGPEFPVLVKLNQRDGFRGGLEIEEALAAAKGMEAAGASAVIPSCGFTARTPLYMLRGRVPTREMAANYRNLLMRLGLHLFGGIFVQRYPFEPLFLLEGARRFREALKIPVIYVGGVLALDQAESLLREGFPFAQVGRATIRDPEFVNRLAAGELEKSDCDQCNRCIAAIEGGGVYCVSRELGLLVR
ncbi:MAG: NADH:flavin oxidoreductase [Spirochaetales bacterium]|nr:NADH:flavin oxidoreductase [Spirochaetales bacterium]